MKGTNRSEPPKRVGKKEPSAALRVLLRVLTVALSVLLVVAAVLVVLNRDQLNLDSIKRRLTYQALERGETGQSAEYRITDAGDCRFAALRDGLLACSTNQIRLYSDSGALYENITASLRQPVIRVMGDYALVYDAGGSSLYLFSGRRLAWEYQSTGSQSLISAQVNPSGWVAVVEQAAGYKGAVTVYNAAHEPVVTENLSSAFVQEAAVSPDCRSLAVLTIGQQEMDFASTLTVYTISDGARAAAAIVSEEPAVELRWDAGGIWLQEMNGVRALDGTCAQTGSWLDGNLYLRGYSLAGSGFAVEYVSQYQAGSVGQVLVMDQTGQITGSLDVSEEILSLSAAGRYIALLTPSGLTVYTSDLEEYASMENNGSVTRAMAREDGTVLLLTGETASVFVP